MTVQILIDMTIQILIDMTVHILIDMTVHILIDMAVHMQSYRHQICDFSRDIILYDFAHSNIGTIFDSTNYSCCYIMIRIDT